MKKRKSYSKKTLSHFSKFALKNAAYILGGNDFNTSAGGISDLSHDNIASISVLKGATS